MDNPFDILELDKPEFQPTKTEEEYLQHISKRLKRCEQIGNESTVF